MEIGFGEFDGPIGDDLDNEEPEVVYLVGSCLKGWTGSGMFFEGDERDFENSSEKLRQEHASSCDCGEPHIGVT